jgi:DNA polymerase-3 subunit delta
VHEFGAPRKENQLKGQARERLIAAMREKALRPDEAVVERLLERVGYDARQIEAEVEKLSLYLGSRRDPSEADVLAIVSFSRGLPGWELAEAAGRRDLPGAMVALTHLMAQGASVIGIAASLAARFRELLIYNVAVQEGWLKASSRSAEWGAVPAEVEALLSKGFERDLRKTHAYRMAKLVEQAEAFSREELGRCLEMIQRAHEVLVTSDASERLVLELLLIKMLRRQEGERRGDALDSTAVCGIVSAACAGQESVS